MQEKRFDHVSRRNQKVTFPPWRCARSALKPQMMSERRHSWSIVICLGFALAGCNRTQPPPDAHSQPLVGSAELAASAPSSSLVETNDTAATKSDGAGASIRVTDERWQRAKGEDLADKQVLADALGATGLVEALDDGGDIARTALLCLPLTDDADSALGVLANRLQAAPNELREAYLVAVLDIAGRPARAREVVDPEGAAQAGEAVLAIAKNAALPREQRVLAISAARAFAEKKIVDSAKIPTDLDPP